MLIPSMVRRSCGIRASPACELVILYVVETRSILDGYFNPLVFWYQWEYLLTSKEFIFFAGYLRLAMEIRKSIILELHQIVSPKTPISNMTSYDYFGRFPIF